MPTTRTDERINAASPPTRRHSGRRRRLPALHVRGRRHAFNNDTSEARYNKEAAELAWSRTVAFLKETLATS